MHFKDGDWRHIAMRSSMQSICGSMCFGAPKKCCEPCWKPAGVQSAPGSANMEEFRSWDCGTSNFLMKRSLFVGFQHGNAFLYVFADMAWGFPRPCALP